MKLATLVRETNFQHCQRAYRTLCGMPLDTYATVADYPDADYCLDAPSWIPVGSVGSQIYIDREAHQ